METDGAAVHEFEGADGRRLVALFVVLVVIVGGFFASSLVSAFVGGGMDDMPGMATASTSRARSLDVEAFASRLASPKTFVVNVHTGGRLIAETDASVPYDAVVGDSRLPSDLDSPLSLYCKTGRMSKQAANALSTAGYRNVSYLSGGTDAWAASGRTLD